MGETLRIAGISDTHFGLVNGHSFTKEEYIEHVKDMSDHADIIIHCGDFTDAGSIEGAKLAADIFRRSRIPVVGVLGNHDYYHDDPTIIETILEEEGGITLLSGDIYTAYKQHSSVNILGATGFSTKHKSKTARQLGISEEEYRKLVNDQLSAFSDSIRTINGGNNIGLLHFQPTKRPQGVNDTDRYSQRSVRSSNYANLIDLHRDNFLFVLYGHDHMGINAPTKTRNGVDTINIAVPISIAMHPGIPYRIINLPLS